MTLFTGVFTVGKGEDPTRGWNGRAPDPARAVAKSTLILLLVFLVAVAAMGLFPVDCRAQSTITLSVDDLRALPPFTGNFSFLKNGAPHPFFEAQYTGVPLETVLNGKLKLQAGASEVVVRGLDGYPVQLKLDQINRQYPNNLKVILAYARYGVPLIDDEGPIRLVVPQSTPGTFESGGDLNMMKCVKQVRTIEVMPAASGAIAPGAVDGNSVVIYGAVEQPAAAPPAAPAESTAEQAQPRPTAPEGDTVPAAPDVVGEQEMILPATALPKLALYIEARAIAAFLPVAHDPFANMILTLAAGR